MQLCNIVTLQLYNMYYATAMCIELTKRVGGQKRKLTGQSTANENKFEEIKTKNPKKAPLKDEIIINLRALGKEYEALKTENEKMKNKSVEFDEKVKQNVLIWDSNHHSEDLDFSFGCVGSWFRHVTKPN